MAAPYLVVPLVRLHLPERVDVSDRIFRQQKTVSRREIYSIIFVLIGFSNRRLHECYTAMTPSREREQRDMVDKAMKGKIEASRKFVDDVLRRQEQYL